MRVSVWWLLIAIWWSVLIPERPQIDMYEKKVVVGSGDTANLHCSAKGIPPPEIHWFKGELEVGSV